MIVMQDCAEPDENVMAAENQVVAYWEKDCLGQGTLFLTDRQMIWMDPATKKGLRIPIPAIVVHAVSTSNEDFAEPCLFTMIDTAKAGVEYTPESDVQEDEDKVKKAAFRLVPANSAQISELFTTLNKCQEELNRNVGGEEEAIPVSDDEDVEEETAANVLNDQQEDQQNGDNGQYGDRALAAKQQEVDEISVAQEISRYMNANKVNIGEVENVVEMWGLCDAISAAHSGLPDSLLKEAFHLVLEGYYGHALNHPWMRKHLDHLMKMWRKEMVKSKSTERPTKFVSSSVVNLTENDSMANEAAEQFEEQKVEEEQTHKFEKQQPSHGGGEEMVKNKEYFARMRRQRKQANARKRALATMMGVGQLLDHARRKFATEEGELDVDEDEFGNFMIGGMELDFETWGKLNKIKDAGIVHVPSPQKLWKSSKRPQNGHSIPHMNAPKPPNLAPNMAEQYPTVDEVEMPMDESKTTRGGKEGKKAPPKPPKEEKDEGEISSSESDRPTSSSEDEAEYGQGKLQQRKGGKRTAENANVGVGGPLRAKNRRTMRREEERQQGASNAQNLQVLLRKCFDLRGKIVAKLSLSQKAAFMDLMKQSIAGNLQPNAQFQQQHQALAQLLGGMQQQRQT